MIDINMEIQLLAMHLDYKTNNVQTNEQNTIEQNFKDAIIVNFHNGIM
jgi:hypothetical protein